VRLDRRAFLARSAGGALSFALPYLPVAEPSAPALPKRAARALRAAVRGPVLFPGTPGYGNARLVYNIKYDGVKPDAVAQPLDTRDVQAIVKWANRFDVHIVPKSGGHSYAGYSTTSNGVVVDLSRMRGIRVNTGQKRATVGGGTQLIDLYAALSVHGVTVPAGSCPSVGVGGHALGGGMGLAGRRFGLASDNITGVTIVTADGRVRHVDSGTNADLLWACRGGGGGNFGIVTSFTFKVHRARGAAWFNLSWPWSAASAALAAWQELVPDAPDALTAIFHLTTGGSSPIASVSGQYFGSVAALRRLIAPLTRVGGTLSIGSSAYMPLMLRWAGCLGDPLPECHTRGTRPGGTLARAAFQAKSDYVDRPLSARARATAIDWIERRQRTPSNGSGALLLDSYGGAINRVKPDATAFVHRDQLFCIQYLAYYGNASATAAWLRGVHRAMRPFVSGEAYQNYIDPGLRSWQREYYGANLGQLRDVKKRYDPDFRFRFRQAIPPAA
jgi:FAD/FMN-containing dehydrogenase